MGVIIDLSTAGGVWTAEHLGDNRRDVEALFGTAILPTPFSEKIPSWEVVAELRRLNPGAVILIGGLEVVA